MGGVPGILLRGRGRGILLRGRGRGILLGKARLQAAAIAQARICWASCTHRLLVNLQVNYYQNPVQISGDFKFRIQRTDIRSVPDKTITSWY